MIDYGSYVASLFIFVFVSLLVRLLTLFHFFILFAWDDVNFVETL
ncbi:hypothetical protein CGMCC3_g5619 [Colletotrichum fructicola]|nr:uncharacterized protein CGMCC3_g5619 [Colletotrichum fructicola]KAE9578634.1 hypothetical protein CGMCC3_g5619 [Colletotrichum fructicola]